MNLLDLAQRQRWSSIIERCQTHPHEIYEQNDDEEGFNVLHSVCCNAPPLRVVLALLHSIPNRHSIESPTMAADRTGCLPLHYACHESSAEVVSELMQFSPEAASIPDSWGFTPLHYTCMRHRPRCVDTDTFEVARVLLSHDPTLAMMENEHQCSPLLLLCSIYRAEMGEVLELPKGGSDCVAFLSGETRSSFSRFLRLLSLLAFASCHGRAPDRDASSLFETFSTFPLLHTLLKIPIHHQHNAILTEVLLAILKIYPEQAKMRDTNGNPLLHSALAKSTLFPCDKTALLIDALLSAYPQATRCKDASSDKLPFLLAIESGLTWDEGIRSIVKSYPEAMETFLGDERLVPFVLGKSAGDDEPDMVFRLLRARPHLVLWAN